MCRHLDLGYDGDISFIGITQYFSDVILCVKPAVGGFFAGFLGFAFGPWIAFMINPPGSDAGKLRVFFNLDAPPVIIAEMPVEGIHFIHGQQIDILLDEFLGEKVAGNVEMHSAVLKPGVVMDLETGNSISRFAAV